MYIEFNTGTPDVVVKGVGGNIGVQLGVTNDVANMLWHKILRRVTTKKGQNTVVHTST